MKHVRIKVPKKTEKPKQIEKPRSQQATQDYIHFTETAKKLDLSPSRLSEAIGYNMNAYHGWKKKGQMPAVAQLACECLLRRRKKIDETPTEKALYILSIPYEHVQTIKAICSAVGITTTKIPEDMS